MEVVSKTKTIPEATVGPRRMSMMRTSSSIVIQIENYIDRFVFRIFFIDNKLTSEPLDISLRQIRKS